MRLLTAWLALLLGVAVSQEAAPKSARPTLVRVIGPDGAPAAHARVLLCSVPLPDYPLVGTVLRRALTDAKGKASVRVGGGRQWSVWAVHDVDGKRFASPLQPLLQPGRPIRLELAPFPVSCVRIQRLAAWRKQTESLALEFVSEASPFPRLPTALPDGDEPVVSVPDLPLGNYHPVLVDKAGFLDARYFSPAFHEGEADVEQLYEREVPLKRVVLGEPTATRWKLTGPDGKAVADASVFVRPNGHGTLMVERRLTSDAEGGFELLLPWRGKGNRGWYRIDLLIVAPGFAPAMYLLPAYDRKKVEFEVRLRSAVTREVQVQNTPPGCSWLYKTMFFGPLQQNRVTVFTPLAVDARDRLRLPGVSQGGAELYLLDDTGAIPAPFDPHHNQTIDAAERIPVALRVVDARGRAVRGGDVQLCRVVDGRAASSVPHAIGPNGVCALGMWPGACLVYVVHPLRGDALAAVTVAKGSPPLEFRLAPFVTLDGSVVKLNEDGEEMPAPSLPVEFVPQLDKVTTPLYWRWYSRVFGPVVTGADGRFRVRLSSLAERAALMSWMVLGSRGFSGNVTFERRDPKPIKIVLR